MMSEFFGVRAGLNVDHLGFDMDFCGVRFWIQSGSHEIRFGFYWDPMGFDLDSDEVRFGFDLNPIGLVIDAIWISLGFDLDSIWIPCDSMWILFGLN